MPLQCVQQNACNPPPALTIVWIFWLEMPSLGQTVLVAVLASLPWPFGRAPPAVAPAVQACTCHCECSSPNEQECSGEGWTFSGVVAGALAGAVGGFILGAIFVAYQLGVFEFSGVSGDPRVLRRDRTRGSLRRGVRGAVPVAEW